ncbi:MAG: polysaccharide deacetylase family protein [Bacillota bacterium]|nr:polysaccharide deacetylase family protein [Bacillota bacterium]
MSMFNRRFFFSILILVSSVLLICGFTSNNNRLSVNETGKIAYVQTNMARSKSKVQEKHYIQDSSSIYNKIAYLTFDDGPSRNNTVETLEVLNKYGIKATFFVLPKDGLDDIYKRILDEGHVLGNHSYSHVYSNVYTSLERFEEDLLKARAFIKERFGYTTKLYRFPGGTIGKRKELIEPRIKILNENGYKHIDWNVSCGDADCCSRQVGKLVRNVLEEAEDKNEIIVLMHDSESKTATAKALPAIIEGLIKQGFQFKALE